LARVPLAGGQQLAGGRVPQARRLVLAGRDEPRAVRAEGQTPDAPGVAFADRRSLAGLRVEHGEPRPLALVAGPRQPRTVRAHDDGAPENLASLASRATKDLASLVEQGTSRFPDPRHYPKPAAGLRGVDRMPAFGANRHCLILPVLQVL